MRKREEWKSVKVERREEEGEETKKQKRDRKRKENKEKKREIVKNIYEMMVQKRGRGKMERGRGK